MLIELRQERTEGAVQDGWKFATAVDHTLTAAGEAFDQREIRLCGAHHIAETDLVGRLRQAAMIGYINAFYLMALTAALSVPLAFLLARLGTEPK